MELAKHFSLGPKSRGYPIVFHFAQSYPAIDQQAPTERKILFVAASLDDPVKGLDLCLKAPTSLARSRQNLDEKHT